MTAVPDNSSILTQIRCDLSSLPITPPLRANVRQHHEHLEQLAGRLKTLGVDDKTINEHVIEIFEQYKSELLKSLESLAGASTDWTEQEKRDV